MTIFYYNEQGRKIGPVSVVELKKLCLAGMIKPDDFLEINGRKIHAHKVQGLVFSGEKVGCPQKDTVPPPIIPDLPEQKKTIPETEPAATPDTESPSSSEETYSTETSASHTSAYCTNCGRPVQEQAMACMSCGAAPFVHKKFCRQCGVALNPEQIVCTKCGVWIGNQINHRMPGSGEHIPDYFVWSLLELICCCIPFGIVALVFSILANNAKRNGDYVRAKEYAHMAKQFLVWGVAIGLIIVIVSLGLSVL